MYYFYPVLLTLIIPPPPPPPPPPPHRRGLDVDEVLVDAAADWKPIEKSPDVKDEDGTV